VTRFVFKSEKKIERDEKGRKVSEWHEFYLSGIKIRKWMLLDVLHGIEEIAGSFKEEVYVSDDYKVYVDVYSEATEVAEHPRTKAISIEDYTGSSPKLIVVFPYLPISENEIVKAIDTSESKQQSKVKFRRQHKGEKRPSIPQRIRGKVLVRSKGKCENCGESLENVTPCIHHKDGNPRNNIMANLVVMCPNCHSNTQTYKRPKQSLKK